MANGIQKLKVELEKLQNQIENLQDPESQHAEQEMGGMSKGDVAKGIGKAVGKVAIGAALSAI